MREYDYGHESIALSPHNLPHSHFYQHLFAYTASLEDKEKSVDQLTQESCEIFEN